MLVDFIHGRFKNVWFMTAWNRGDDTIIIWSEQPNETNEELPVYYCSLNDYLQNGSELAIRQGKTNDGTPFYFNRLNAVQYSAQTNDIIYFFNVYFDKQRKRPRDVSFNGNFFSLSDNSSYCGAFYRDRLVLVEHSDRNVVKWSMPNQFNNFETEDWVSVEPFDNDVITAIVTYLNSVVVFKRNHIYRIIDLPPSQVRTISTKHGCLAPQSVRVWQNYLFFINQYGHLCVTGGGDEDIKEITPSELQNEVEKHQPEIIGNTLFNKKYTYFPPWNKSNQYKTTIESDVLYRFDNDGTINCLLTDMTISVQSPGTVTNPEIKQIPFRISGMPINEAIWEGFVAVNLPKLMLTNSSPNFNGVYCESIAIPIYVYNPAENISEVNIKAAIVRGDNTLFIPDNGKECPISERLPKDEYESILRSYIHGLTANAIQASVKVGTNRHYTCIFNYFPTPPPRPTIEDLGNNPPALASDINYWLLLWAEDDNGNLFINNNYRSDVIFKFYGGEIEDNGLAVGSPVASLLGIFFSEYYNKMILSIHPFKNETDKFIVFHSDGGIWSFPRIKFWFYNGSHINVIIYHSADFLGRSVEKIEFDFSPFIDKGVENMIYFENTSKKISFRTIKSKFLNIPPMIMQANDEIKWGTNIVFNSLHAPKIFSAMAMSLNSVFSGSEMPTLVSTQRALYIFLPERGDTVDNYRYIRYDGKNFSVFKDRAKVSPVSAFSIQDGIVCYICQDTGKLVLFSEIPEYQNKIKSLPLYITSSPRVITRNAPLLPLIQQVGLVRRAIIAVNNVNAQSSVKIRLKSDTDTSPVDYEFPMDSNQKVIGLPPFLARHLQAEITVRAFDGQQGLYPLVVEWIPQRAGDVKDSIRILPVGEE